MKKQKYGFKKDGTYTFIGTKSDDYWERFWLAIRRVTPEVFDALYKDVFPHYQENTWGNDPLLFENLDSWRKNHNINYPRIRDLAFATLKHWYQSEEARNCREPAKLEVVILDYSLVRFQEFQFTHKLSFTSPHDYDAANVRDELQKQFDNALEGYLKSIQAIIDGGHYEELDRSKHQLDVHFEWLALYLIENKSHKCIAEKYIAEYGDRGLTDVAVGKGISGSGSTFGY